MADKGRPGGVRQTDSVRKVLLTGVLMAAATVARAGPAEEDCRIERMSSAKAACLELVFESRFLAMQAAISQTMSRLQAATAGELIELGGRYETAQEAWYAEVRDWCAFGNEGDPVAFESCRLDELALREDDLTASLAGAAADLGAPPEYRAPIPDQVELLFPLPARLPFGGRARLPLLVPIHPH